MMRAFYFGTHEDALTVVAMVCFGSGGKHSTTPLVLVAPPPPPSAVGGQQGGDNHHQEIECRWVKNLTDMRIGEFLLFSANYLFVYNFYRDIRHHSRLEMAPSRWRWRPFVWQPWASRIRVPTAGRHTERCANKR